MAVNVKVEDNSDKIREDLNDAIERAMVQIGIQAEGYAKGELSTPKAHISGEPIVRPNVDTGRLRASITYATQNHHSQPEAQAKSGDSTKYSQVGAGTVVIGTNVEYAPYIEYGTSRGGKFPYLRPAIEKHVNEYKQIIRDSLGV